MLGNFQMYVFFEIIIYILLAITEYISWIIKGNYGPVSAYSSAVHYLIKQMLSKHNPYSSLKNISILPVGF